MCIAVARLHPLLDWPFVIVAWGQQLSKLQEYDSHIGDTNFRLGCGALLLRIGKLTNSYNPRYLLTKYIGN